jgi:hypothetical protein
MKIKTKQLVALRNLYYDGDRKEGESFEAREEHWDVLIRTGAAKPAEEDSKDGRYQRRDLRAEP